MLPGVNNVLQRLLYLRYNSADECIAFLFTHQKLFLVFGLEHGSHLLQVQPISLLFQLRREEDGDDPLGDVGEVKVVVSFHHSLHHTVHAETPGGTEKRQQGSVGCLW